LGEGARSTCVSGIAIKERGKLRKKARKIGRKGRLVYLIFFCLYTPRNNLFEFERSNPFVY